MFEHHERDFSEKYYRLLARFDLLEARMNKEFGKKCGECGHVTEPEAETKDQPSDACDNQALVGKVTHAPCRCQPVVQQYKVL